MQKDPRHHVLGPDLDCDLLVRPDLVAVQHDEVTFADFGFFDPSNFSKHVKRYLGDPPGDIRNS